MIYASDAALFADLLEDIKITLAIMQKLSYICVVLMVTLRTISSEEEYKGGYVNGQRVGRCVAGFCLPAEYNKLEQPSMDGVNPVSIEIALMDVLMVKTIQFSILILRYCNCMGFKGQTVLCFGNVKYIFFWFAGERQGI